MGLVALAVGGVVLVLIMIALGVMVGRNKNNGETMERGADMIKTVYIYVVLLATLMMTIGGSVAAFMAVADLVAPPVYTQTFEEFQQMNGKVPPGVTAQQNGTPSQAELKASYDRYVAQQEQNTKDRALNSLIKSLGWIVIPFPVFMYFQKKVRAQG